MIADGTQFERLVADFCTRVWDPSTVAVNRIIDGREIDILVESPKEVVFIECTIERGKKKAQNDIYKIREFRKLVVGDSAHKIIRGYFITQHDPSPDVHKVAEMHGSWIEACSFPAFINKFNCSSTYIIERGKCQFGSIRNPADDSLNVTRNQYIEVPMRLVGSGRIVSLEQYVEGIITRKQKTRLILTGDFGVGKSMTFRELYFRLAEKYIAGETYRFPMYINLKDGSFDKNDDARDLIERHAKWVGLREDRDKLVHAWRSDCCILFLDGFDEVVRSGFGRIATSKELRYSSGHIVRSLVRETNQNTPIFISGRQSYFSAFKEMRECLAAQYFEHVSLHDLNEREVRKLYRKILPGGNPIIFDWLPQRPLLLSYLYFAFGDELAQVHEISSTVSPGRGWHMLLNRLCARETEVALQAMPSQIRRVLDRVALYGRTNMENPVRVTSLQLNQAYTEIFGMAPDYSVQQVLMRLPGLSPGGAAEDRGFIDDNFFDAAQAGTLVELIEALGTRDKSMLRSDSIKPIIALLRKTRSVISSLCAQVVIAELRENNQLGVLGIALQEAIANEEFSSGNTIGDLFMCALEQPDIGFRDELHSITMNGTYFSELEITKESLRYAKIVVFRDCVIDRLELDLDHSCIGKLIFEKSQIGKLTCSQELAARRGDFGLSADVDQVVLFDSANSDVLALPLPKTLKAAKIILRKLFREERASGRIKEALLRGIGTLKQPVVEEALAALAKHKIICVVGNPADATSVWYGNRAQATRANMIMDSERADDVIVKQLGLV